MEKNIKIAGVSLIEVMISMVLIALLLIAVVSIFPRMASHRKGIQESDIAKAIAAETLEYLQTYSQNHKCSDNLGVDLSRDALITGYVIEGDGPYVTRPIGAVEYKIFWPNPCGGSSDFYPVEVTVGWTKQGKPHTIKVTGTVQ